MGKTPLQWQTEAAEKAAKENVIVFAETGSGKTLVAELAIKEALLQQPEKRCAFLVTATRLLAHQQWLRLSESLREADPSIEADGVVEITGYTTSDWKESAWTNCFERAQVFVGTVETFARAVVDHGYLQLANFSLLVIDEAHKACGDSPAAELLHHLAAFRGGSAAALPRVLGLTASYANDGAKTWEEFQESRRNLQATFRAQLHVCSVPPRKKPKFERIEYAPSRLALEAKSAASLVCQSLWQGLRQADLKEPKEAERLTQHLAELLTELGREGFELGLQQGLVAQLEGRIDSFSKMVETKRLAERLEADVKQLKSALRAAAQALENLDPLRSFAPRSEKLEALIRCLRSEFDLNVDGSGKANDSCGMVFVSQVALALPLASLLSQQLPTVAVAAVSGVNSMTEKQRNSAFSDFRMGRTRLLVCTQCAEEGLDVAECSFVVRFNQVTTTRSHVQGVGRARAEEARVYYFDNCPVTECHLAEVMEAVARDATEDVVPAALPAYCQWSSVHPFQVPGGTAEVNFRSAQRIWARYLSVTSGQESFKSLQFPGGLLLPGPQGGLKLQEADVYNFMAEAEHRDVEKKTLMKYVAILALHQKGWLDKHNTVLPQIAAQTSSWQKSITAAEDFACWQLCFLVSNGHRHRRFDGSQRHREEKDHTEQVELGTMRLKPEEIQNSQLTVNTTFSNGGSVMGAMAGLVEGSKRVEDFPLIRAAWSSSGQRWYSADNRRLFIYKVVAPLMDLETIEVQVINWTSEFECKIQQNGRFGRVWATHDKSVALVRHQLLETMARGDSFQTRPENPAEMEPSERARSILDDLSFVEAADETLEAVEEAPTPSPQSRNSAPKFGRGDAQEIQDELDAAEVSPRSQATEESWEVLEDYELCEAGASERLPVELVLEPDHGTSCQSFQPKKQLLEHLQELLGRTPNQFECRFAFKGWKNFWRCRVEVHLPNLQGSFEGVPAQTPEQAEQNAAWRVLEKLKLIKVVRLHRTDTLQDALRTLPNSENLELVQDGCVVSGELQLWQLRCLRFEVRDAEPW